MMKDMKKDIQKDTKTESKKEKEKKIQPKFESDQSFFSARLNKTVLLRDFIKEGDWWETKGKRKAVILTHDAVKRIALEASVVATEYKILTQPDCYNNYQYTIQATVVNPKGHTFIEIGEANRSNLGSRGRNNPANMAQKRAFDRAVLNAVGITGILSEEELQDEEPFENMEKLTPDESKAIAPLLNKLIAAKTKKDIETFNKEMKLANLSVYNKNQIDYLRQLFKKRSAELTNSF